MGKHFSLWLNLEAQPDVGSNFSWTKDGVAYQGDVSATSLNISNVALGDAGVYNVIASNSLDSDSYSFTLTVTGEFTIMQCTSTEDEYLCNCYKQAEQSCIIVHSCSCPLNSGQVHFMQLIMSYTVCVLLFISILRSIHIIKFLQVQQCLYSALTLK